MKAQITCILNNEIETFSINNEEVSSFIQEKLKFNVLVFSYEDIPTICEGRATFVENERYLKVYIPEKINSFQMTEGYCYLKQCEQNQRIRNRFIQNQLDSQNYDYFDEKQNTIFNLDVNIIKTIIRDYPKLKDYNDDQLEELIYKLKEKSKASNIFLEYSREKLNLLTKEEQEMFLKYRTFDLEYLLCSNESLLYPVNCDNAGCISIFKDKTYHSTVTKMQHGKEFKNHFSKEDVGGLSNLSDTTDEKQVILIQVLRGEFIIWLPNELTKYQKQTLLEYLGKINHFEKKDSIVVVTNKTDDYSLDEIIEFITEYPELKISKSKLHD
ncbi:hypothetical protein EGP64_03335 [bacterium]|nr:hypothetical protein [bacterium]